MCGQYLQFFRQCSQALPRLIFWQRSVLMESIPIWRRQSVPWWLLLWHGGWYFCTHTQSGITEISKKSAVFDLIRSGNRCILLCYYRALQMGEASKVVPIDKLSVVITLVLAFVFLHEEFTAKSLIGCILIGVGTLVMVL